MRGILSFTVQGALAMTATTHILVVFKEDLVVVVIPEDRMLCQAREEHLVHCHCLLEGCQVLSVGVVW